ncbi:MAG: hypothetical protein ACI9MF_000487, partial [Gammaproteobacteria bacterium]
MARKQSNLNDGELVILEHESRVLRDNPL